MIGVIVVTLACVPLIVDAGLHNTAFAQAANDLGMSASQRSIGASVSTLVLAASILAVGNFGDRLGRKRVLLLCLATLTVGGVITAAAPSFGVYVIGRALTGLGLAGAFSLSMALIRTVMPDNVPRGMSMYFTFQVLLPLPIVLLGGVLLAQSWRIGYLVGPAVAVVAIVLNKAMTPEAKADHVGKLDVLGLALVAVALVSLIWGVSGAATTGWTSARVLVPLVLAVLAFAGFIWWESRIPEPAFPVTLFKDPDLAGSLAAGVSFNMYQAVMLIQLAMLWQYVYLYNPFQVTLGQLPATLAMVVGAAAAGRFMARGVGANPLILIGLVGVILGMLIFSAGGLSTPYILFAIGLSIGGFGRMLTETASGQYFVTKPPPDLVGATAASKPAIGQASFALGLALSSSFLYAGFGQGLQDAFDEAGVPPAVRGEAVGAILQNSSTATEDIANDQIRALVQGAQAEYVQAYSSTMLIFAGIFTVLFFVCAYFLWWVPRASKRKAATSAS
jgi:MFS family permease